MSLFSPAERVRCSVTARRAAALVMEGRRFPPRLAAHTDQCLNCQAKIAHARAVSRGLASLRHPIERAPVEMVRLVLAGLDTPLPARWAGSRLVPAMAAAAAAAAVAVIVIRRHPAA